MQARDESDQARRSRARTESPSAAGRGNAPSGTAGFFMDLQRKAGNRAVTEMIRTAGSTVERVQVSRMFLAGKGGGKFNPKGLTIVVPERREYNGAIPRDYRLDGYVALSEASENYGMDVNMKWDSSTGELRDLEQVPSAELIDPVNATGALAGMGTRTSTWGQISTHHGTAPDQHGFPQARATGPGTSLTRQLYLYKTPTSPDEQVAPGSGFEIRRWIENDPDRTAALQVRTEKEGAAVTIGQQTGTAGAGFAQTIEKVPLPGAQ